MSPPSQTAMFSCYVRFVACHHGLRYLAIDLVRKVVLQAKDEKEIEVVKETINEQNQRDEEDKEEVVVEKEEEGHVVKQEGGREGGGREGGRGEGRDVGRGDD